MREREREREGERGLMEREKDVGVYFTTDRPKQAFVSRSGCERNGRGERGVREREREMMKTK